MDISISNKDNFIIAELNGRLDTTHSATAQQKFDGLLSDGAKNIIIDCKGLSYVSSTGLRVFLMLLKRMSGNGYKLHLCNLSSNINEIFNISGFSKLFKIFHSVEEALS